jgi:anhydro-N-acetylmuramic acid kinase
MRDLIATVTVLTAATIAVSVRSSAGQGSARQPQELIASGGGVHNGQIMSHLAAFLPEVAIATSTDYGVDADAKEAIAFAVLAYETLRGRPSNVTGATGARRDAILGSITPGPGPRSAAR